MAIKETPPGHIEAYRWEMLASRSELAVLRTKRVGELSGSDKKALMVLVDHLQSAMDGAIAVTSSTLAAKNEESIFVFQSILGAFADNTTIGDLIRSRLEQLQKTAKSLVSGEVPDLQELDELGNFLHRYRLSQQDAIRQKLHTSGGRVAVWGIGQPVSSL